jgi:hypothetical protein
MYKMVLEELQCHQQKLPDCLDVKRAIHITIMVRLSDARLVA